MKTVLLLCLLAIAALTHAADYRPDTWRPTLAQVSLAYGGTDKLIDPRTGDYCDQRCLLLRVQTRAFVGWPLVLRYLRTLPGGDAALKSQLNPTAGLPMVWSEIHFENSCHNLVCPRADGTRPAGKTGTWNFGPDYDWIGNVAGRLADARTFILNAAKHQTLDVPEDVLVFLNLRREGKGLAIGRPDAGVVKLSSGADPGAKLRGVVNTKQGCQPLTPEQDAALDLTMSLHAENGEYWKAHDAPKDGLGPRVMAAHAALEALARDADELTRFTIPVFPGTIDTSRPKRERDALLDDAETEHHAWATAVRSCSADPPLQRARIWAHGLLHTRAHLFLALNLPMGLRALCADPLVDACPNAAFPPAGFYDRSF